MWGPTPVASFNGNYYFVLFLDDCTQYLWVYFMSTKSQVFDIFKMFKVMVETQFQSTIKFVQIDWAEEYRNVSQFLTSLGIGHRVSYPQKQEQNGAVERRNRIIVEKGLSLLAHAHLPLLFWENAFHTVTYLINRTISPTLAQ